ncbi:MULTISPECIES: hypothetical protein [Streptomyces]|uniref:DUF2087 domain-containing protein n=2 Tax=Streptomyces TaxID=1883 RepID=A0A117IW90_9ACTN|nr:MULTISPECIES: hypothetical protein [Streptomyces]KUH38420.1 hypothetical protein ATE80_13205 [Streptomyces kanasensis]UUS30868.1 hypothetical protein NRO40_08470 [Streptomyces changanensis]
MSAARLAVLRTAVRAEAGEWTTHDVQRLYRACGIDAPFRATARRDLAREGLLALDDSNSDRRVFRACGRARTGGAA